MNRPHCVQRRIEPVGCFFCFCVKGSGYIFTCGEGVRIKRIVRVLINYYTGYYFERRFY